MNKMERRIQQAVKAAIGDNAFINMVAGLGTVRDKQSAGEYVSNKRMSIKSLNNIYEADWIAERIINKPAYDAIRAGWYYSKLESGVDDLMTNTFKELSINRVLLRALALSRLHGWSYILIGSNDSDDLKNELDLNKGDFQFLTALNRDQCSEWGEGDYLSAVVTKGIYDEPEFYNIGTKYDPELIHNSRIIKLELPDPVGNAKDGKPTPILQRIEQVLKRTASASTNAGSLIYEAKIDVIGVPDLMKNLASRPSATVNGIFQRFTSLATLKGNNGMIVRDANETYDSKSYSFGGLPELMREFKVETAGAANMPYSLLFGQSPAGMNATGDFDMRSYYDNISTIQEHTLRGAIEEIVKLIAQSHGYDVDDIGLVFNSLWQLDDKTRAEVEVANANRDAVYINLGVITEAQVARQLVDDGTYTVIDDAHITLLESMAGAYDDTTAITATA